MARVNKEISNSAGIPDSQGACVVIVRTEWNTEVLDKLESGCKKTLAKLKVKNVRVLTVPGAFEIPFAIRNYWDAHKYKDDKPQAFIALGCIIRGDTPHFDYVCKAATEGVLQLNLMLPVPTIFGVLTVDNQKQADERTGGKHGHKGKEAAVTALKMIALANSFKQIEHK